MIRPFAIRTDAEKATDAIEKSVVSVLAYFDIFRYPLTIGEIEQFRAAGGANRDIHACLDRLLRKGIIFRVGDFYSLQSNILLGHRRKEGNMRALAMLDKAIRIGRFLYRFPYVKAVGISGSLSKNFATETSDFDFFIVTAANRLWIARTLMHAFKKLVILLGRQRYYCMNYYIDEKAMVLNDRNIYSAIELKTLLPVAGSQRFADLFSWNSWADDLLPFCSYRKQALPDPGKGFFKWIVESVFNNRLGERLDNWLFHISSKRWEKKELAGKTNERGEVMCLLTAKHFAKSNPGEFQERMLQLYENRCKVLLQQLQGGSISSENL